MDRFPFQGLLCLNGWGGYSEQPCLVIGETPKRYRIEATQRTRLPGRLRWIYTREQALVPKPAIKRT